VLCDAVNKFKSYLDKDWQYQDIVYDYKVEIHETGSRSSHYKNQLYKIYEYFDSFVFVMRA